MRGTKKAAQLSIALIASCVLLTACGQRGALYLPDESSNVVVTPAPVAAPAAPAASPADAAATEPTEEQRRNATAPAK
jgi:predicted small lipoprotein YifL